MPWKWIIIVMVANLRHTNGYAVRNRENFADRLPNVRYLGTGYNVVFGNPHNDLYDPGFSVPVLDFPYTLGRRTSDHRFEVPDAVVALQTRSCKFESTTSEVKGASSYRDSLSVDAEVNLKVFAFKFSASTGYKEVSEKTSQQHRMFTSSVAKCIAYTLDMRHFRFQPINVTSHFSNAVESLPLYRNDSAYNDFIATYGTHFAKYLVMGAKMVVRTEFEQTAWSKMKSSNLNIHVGAGASFLGLISTSIEVGTEIEKESKEAFESFRSSYSATYIGSHPPSDGALPTWASESENAPYPIAYKLEPIITLINKKYFPSLDDGELAIKRQLMYDAYQIYCEGVPDCHIPPPDGLLVDLKKKTTNFMKDDYARCPAGYRPLSCGMDNSDASTQGVNDVGRFTKPEFDRCHCMGASEARCVAWCAKGVHVQIAESSPANGDLPFSKMCPYDHKVLGCHIVPATSNEKWRATYPTSDGNGCSCYDSTGGQCYATCAKNLTNHEIVSDYGKGNITVSCTSGNFVLGCGIRPNKEGSESESRRTYFVEDLTSCNCYDRHGATCYAVCGQFVY